MRKGNGVREWEKEPEERRDEDVMLQRTGSGTKEMDSSPEPPERRQPSPLILGLLPPEM